MSEHLTKCQEAEIEISLRLPELNRLYHSCLRNQMLVTSVVLPARLNIPYEGDDADPNFKGSCFGLPITWVEEERWGVICALVT
jgi:hypothetical protein